MNKYRYVLISVFKGVRKMLDRNVVVGQRIRALRMQKGLGQSQAAKMIGIS